MKNVTVVTDKLCWWFSYISMIVTVLMVVLLTADVILRKVTPLFGDAWSIKGCYEVVQMALCAFVFSTWAYTQCVHGHIHVTMFVSKMHQKPKFILFAFTSLLSVATMAFGAYAAFFQINVVRASGECTANLLIPYWPFYLFEFISLALLSVVLLRDAIKAIMAIWDTETAEEIEKEWS